MQQIVNEDRFVELVRRAVYTVERAEWMPPGQARGIVEDLHKILTRELARLTSENDRLRAEIRELRKVALPTLTTTWGEIG